MIAYYGSRISPHMTRTPEGFLICLDVPIARVGEQEYAARELPGVDAAYGERISVLRPEEEVLCEAALASFEGKPVTSPHPPAEGVRPDNWAALAKGHAQNVRAGKGEQAGMVVADLVIHDANLISAIDGGLREVSCGYEYTLRKNEDGSYAQTRIRGNHVAIVPEGRAGPMVSIQDSAPEEAHTNEARDGPRNERSKSMSKTRKSILGSMFSAFAKDADPEEVAEAIDMLTQPEEKLAAETDNAPGGAPDPLAEIAAKLASLQEQIDALKGGNSLDTLESELVGDEEPEEEESKTVEADDSEPEGEEKEPDTAQDRAAALRVLRAIKPVIAGLPEAERATASDAISKALREVKGKPARAKDANGYQQIASVVAQNSQSMAKDAQSKADQAASGVPYDLDAAKSAYQRRNPHAIIKEGK